MTTLEVFFEDPHLIVLNKPSGLLSQGEHTGDENLVDLLRDRFKRHYVGLVHRLDRNTSGLMVVAKRSKAAERLTRALQNGELHRDYLAWLEGKLSPLEVSQHWKDWLLRDEKTQLTRIARPGAAQAPGRAQTSSGARAPSNAQAPNHPQAKEALLEVRPLSHGSRQGQTITLCEFTLETGRTHQIRAQSASRGHPLLGDRKYGAQLAFQRLALHSHRLSFPHPMSQERLSFQCPLPQELQLHSKSGQSSG
ncbi:MAG: Ribosomal large subunit pseudouridine synthase [Pseudomonadota bacterium]